MDIWSIIGGSVIVAVLIWPILALYLAGKTSMDTFAIGAGAFALSIGAMEWIDVVFEDPHPSVFIALGCLLIALGMMGPAMRWASWLVALVGFVVAVVTLHRFQGDEYQGTGSLVLFLVFGLYLAMGIPGKWRDFLFGPCRFPLLVAPRVLSRRSQPEPLRREPRARAQPLNTLARWYSRKLCCSRLNSPTRVPASMPHLSKRLSRTSGTTSSSSLVEKLM
jgi:hypothetical protein